MALSLYAHPFSSYCQKVLIALFENDTPFELRFLDHTDEAILAEWAALWPIRKMPVLVDEGRTVVESSVIIEHLDIHHRGRVRFVPEDPAEALEVRTLDRVFDNYVETPMQKIVGDGMRAEGEKDPAGVAAARALLDRTYGWLDARMAGREWAVGSSFGLADCAAAPALFYADWAHPFGDRHPALAAYRQRLLARPSFARAVDDARPFRQLFPLGAPDRD